MSDTSNPARIERDLDETRSRLGTHLNELQERLSPGQVLDDLMGYFRGSEGAAFGQNLVANIRANPMPAAITGIGLAWLMASGPRAGAPGVRPISSERLPHYGREDYGATMGRLREAEQGVTRHADEPEHAYSARLDVARGQAIGLARHAQETTESFSERVRDALAAAERAVSGTAHDIRDQVSGALEAVTGAIGSLGASTRNAAQGAAGYAGGTLSHGGQAAGQLGGNMVAALTESPVLLGALGLAAGALLGALVPQSDQEEAALGGIARQARDAASSLASQGMEGGRHVAQAVADKAHESAQAHGLAAGKTPGQLLDAALSGELAGGAADVVKDVLQTGDEAVRNEVSQAGSQPGASSAHPPASVA